jgi:thioredoxin reductase (NADPH)
MESAQAAIVGAGPIGIELAVALKKARIDYFHFDAAQIGQTISWFAPQTRFFSSNERIAIAGVPLFTADQTKSTREQYLAYLRGVVVQFDLRIHTYEPVTKIDRQNNEFILTTNRRGSQNQFKVSKLILATGGTATPRLLNVPGENLPHVTHYFQDPHLYFGQKLLIIGGKNSAVEAALRAQQAGAQVSISYRKPEIDSQRIKYWLWPEISGLMKSGKIAAYLNTKVVEILPGKVILAQPDGKTIPVQADFVLAMTGYKADMSLFKMAGVKLNDAGEVPQFDPNTMQTNIPSLYIAGTATAGTQDRYAVFIENCHIHVEKILASLTGHTPPPVPAPLERPES